jgi:hypothetical protein
MRLDVALSRNGYILIKLGQDWTYHTTNRSFEPCCGLGLKIWRVGHR